MIVLTVLDFEDGRVYQYKLENACEDMGGKQFEDIIEAQGHRLKDCEWMSHSDDTINKIKIEL
jgi:hypothetical protein